MAERQIIALEDVAHLAELSRLKISPEEQSLFAEQFGAILDYMEVLSHVDTEGVEPLYSPGANFCKLRADTVDTRTNRTAILANAPQTDGQYFIVPRIV